ncbi:hypothetical protein HPB49_018363 [Dermacentor silvarum]|uniref:Uncharacterized protein n=1 Tax=Dermacentor silvarum TaxID=543639 RepID=A0ACB8CGV4_DERSI|nr:hypothetical protein HPB49_018363 [Dermacentor silvarum]
MPSIRCSLQRALDAVTASLGSIGLTVSTAKTDAMLIHPLASARRYTKQLKIVGRRRAPLTGDPCKHAGARRPEAEQLACREQTTPCRPRVGRRRELALSAGDNALPVAPGYAIGYADGVTEAAEAVRCPPPSSSIYACLLPRCKSSSKQRTPGISFHEIPSDPELRAKWLKVISRDDWTPNTTSCYSTVCSRHFGSSDFKEGCTIRKLKKDAVPSIFEEYPAYLQAPKNREISDASAGKREAAAPAVNTPPPKRRAVESQLESPSLPLNDLPSVDVASQELSLMDCSATELPLPLENGASERCITTTCRWTELYVQVSSLFSVSAMDKRKWRRKERDSNARIERLKNTVDKYKQELQKLKEECYVSAFLQVVEKEKDLAASI